MAISRHFFARSALMAAAGIVAETTMIWAGKITAAKAVKKFRMKDLPRHKAGLGRI
jgi:hypothetical protein